MRAIVFIYFFIFMHVNASFMDEFRSAMHNVEHGFEKLLSDVVTDMKETLDCTISAVEHVLYINGIFKEPSDHRYKCSGVVPDVPPYNVRNPNNGKQMDYDKILPSNIPNTDNGHDKHFMREHLQSSILSVNRSLSNIFDDRENSKKIQDISDSLRSETDRLTEVSELLRKELNTIYKNAKYSFDNNSPEDSIWHDIKLLEDIENKSNSSVEILRAHKVLDTALNTLKTNGINHDSKINNIIHELESNSNDNKHQEINTHSNENVKHSNDFSHTVNQRENDRVNLHNIAKSIFNYDSKVSKTTEPLLNPVVHETHKDAVIDQAKSIIEESHQTDKLFETEHAGYNLFDNLNMFNFG